MHHYNYFGGVKVALFMGVLALSLLTVYRGGNSISSYYYDNYNNDQHQHDEYDEESDHTGMMLEVDQEFLSLEVTTKRSSNPTKLREGNRANHSSDYQAAAHTNGNKNVPSTSASTAEASTTTPPTTTTMAPKLATTKEPTKEPQQQEQQGLLEEDHFDASMTPEDYRALANPSRPSQEWLKNCAETLATDPTIVKTFPVLRPNYVLGDCIKSCYCPERGSYKTTMASYYFRWACRSRRSNQLKSNLTIVEKILGEFHVDKKHDANFTKPLPQDIVIHLRLGDVLEDRTINVTKALIEGSQAAHPQSHRGKIKTVRSVYEYLDILETEMAQSDNHHTTTINSPTKVVIVGGSHKPDAYQKSRVYAACLERGLAKAGIPVTSRLEGGNADVDFYYMSHAQRFITSTGGFSRLMGQLVQNHGGRLLGRSFDNVTSMAEFQ